MADLQHYDVPGGHLPWVAMGGRTGPGPVVVAIPGLSDGLHPLSEPGSIALLRDVAGNATGCRILSLSHRHPVDGATTATLAEDVARFVEDVVGHAVVVSAHSMGGMVAQHLAATRPDLVSHLVMTATLARPDDGFRRVLGRWQDLVERGRWRAFYADANACSYTGSELLRRRLLLRVTRPTASPHLVDRHVALTRAALSHDATDVLGRISSPTMVVAGARDRVVAPAASRDLAAAIPGARFAVLDRLAHGFAEQAPARMTALIAEHLDLDLDLKVDA